MPRKLKIALWRRMTMKEFDPKREFLFDYITVVAECTFAIAVIGSLFARNNSISFIYFFLPFGLALICMIPWTVLFGLEKGRGRAPIYLKEDMTITQIMWQRGIELVVLEIAMCAVIYLIMSDSVSIVVYVAILISTAICDVLSYLVKWYLEKEEADKINRRIAERRRKKENE